MTFEEKVLKSNRIYEGKVVNLRCDEVINVSGRLAQREIVEHNGGAALVVFTDQKKFVMVKQYRNAPGKILIETPAGKTDGNEDPYETAVRELREETGYTAGRIEKLASMYASPGYCEEFLHIYLCMELSSGQTEFDESEAIDICEYTASEILSMIELGQIEDAKTIAGFFLAKYKLEQSGLL
ncbi:MAG: NUDIX hydrolase [Eubacteriales bacterium]|nr:NUDIX hydrolase [Eubacteriales bacterium]MDD4389522.1 NUDIX hydrolase [Eubacteriales bacterium]